MKNVTKRLEAKSIIDRGFSIGLVLFAVLSTVSCKEDIPGGGSSTRNVMSFTVGNARLDTKSGVSPESCETQVASYALDEIDGEQLSLVETVSSIESLYGEEPVETKSTPVYTENFDTLYGEQLYATAFEPKTGDASAYAAKDVWGSYLENGGTVNFKLDPEKAHTYYYDYSKGQAVNLAWPAGGSLLYFLQAPYNKTSALAPVFYSDGSIQFDYTDPTTPTDVGGRPTIVNGASAQSDILFTSKVVNQPAKGGSNSHNILMYHALTAVKFKVNNEEPNPKEVTTSIDKVTFKAIKASGHCTITPNYTDGNTTAGSNPSNKDGDAGSKSSKCSKWIFPEDGALVVDYSQTFSGVVDYNNKNSNFGGSFYGGKSNLKNLGNTDGSEIMLMIPQSLKDVEIEVAFTIKFGDDVEKHYTRTVKLPDTAVWKAGELHTYTITVNKVNVSIDDRMNDAKTKKDGVTTSNSGNVTAYLRATYALAWYYGYGEEATCVAAYLGNGEFLMFGGPNEKDGYKLTWIKGSDGFYYYTWPVLPGRSTRFPFFGSFSAPVESETGPFPGSHLEMNILLQGVQYDENKEKVTAAWGDVYTVGEDGKPTTTKIVDVLSNEIENKSI